MALQQPGRLGCLWEKNPSLRLSRRVLSTPELHMWWTKRPTYPSLPPSVPPLCRRAIGTNATQRSATQRDPTTPTQLSPAQPSPTRPIPIRSSQGSCRDKKRQQPGLRPFRVPAGWSLPGDPEIQLQTDPGQVPPRAPDHIQSVHGTGQTDDFCLRDSPGPCLVRACLLARLPACLPTPSSIYYYPHPIKVHLLILCNPALPCPDPASHFCTLHAAPRRATCLPTSVELRGTHSLTVPPSTGSHHAVCPCPAHSCPHWTLPRVPVSPLLPTFRPSSLRTACIIRPSLP